MFLLMKTLEGRVRAGRVRKRNLRYRDHAPLGPFSRPDVVNGLTPLIAHQLEDFGFVCGQPRQPRLMKVVVLPACVVRSKTTTLLAADRNAERKQSNASGSRRKASASTVTM